MRRSQLRTPLAGLRAHTEIALAQGMPEAHRAQLEQVHLATIRTARLANQLLALARAEPGGFRADAFASVNLRAMVEDAADEWVHRAMAKEIDLGFDLADVQVSGDPLLLREALANLIHNALEYTPHGGRVTVRTGVRNSAPFLEVEDDGPGIPAAEREQVLDAPTAPPEPPAPAAASACRSCARSRWRTARRSRSVRARARMVSL